MINKNEQENIVRPPIIVVMGHIDHGKSTLLDYIRKTNIVEKEIGGITQRISAYEVSRKEEGKINKITFIDTPGHEAFSKMRARGAKIADIAILIVSAEDGVKPQTIESFKTIKESKIPFIVAINKIDKPGANIEKTKTELAENEIYLEGYGGDVPFALISAHTGEGIDNLLSTINIVAEMEELKGNKNQNAEGFVIEANLNPKRGIEATLIIKNGTLKKGMFVSVGECICPTKILENFKGEVIEEASFSSPVKLVGFDYMPKIGEDFLSFTRKEEAVNYSEENKLIKDKIKKQLETKDLSNKKYVPIILKTDVSGSLEAIEKEIKKIKTDNTEFKIIIQGEGPLTEADIKNISQPEETLVIGFNVKADNNATELAQRKNIKINFFNIIYKMIEWLEVELENKRIKTKTLETTGKAKVLKTFNRTKDRQIIGGKVFEGSISFNNTLKITRRDFEIGQAKIINLEKNKNKTQEIIKGDEFGMMIETKTEIVAGDNLEACCLIEK